MNRAQRAQVVTAHLDKLFPVVEIPLHHRDSYTLLIAVLLSARCTDAKVNSITPKLFALADRPETMAKLDISTVQNIIRPCGLSLQKARAIVKLSQILVEKFAGQVPNTFADLEDLPGVGHKTASVVMAQAFDHAAFPVDTHIHRLAKIWKLSSGKSVEVTESDLKKLFPESSWSKLHLQIIYYGRQHCPARRCKKKSCSLYRALNSVRPSFSGEEFLK